MKKFTVFKQFDQMDCGPTCLRMISKFHGRDILTENLRQLSFLTKQGVSLMGLSHAAEKIGLKSFATRVNLSILLKKVPLPCIIPWKGNHLVVLFKTTKKYAYIADPKFGKRKIYHSELKNHWYDREDNGIAMTFNPTPEFYNQGKEDKASFSYFAKHFLPHKNLLLQVFFAIIFSSIVSLLIPFITQSIVDIGILGKNIKFIYLILIAQLIMTIGGTIVSFIQAWISLHLSIRISLSFIINYVAKLMNMSYAFFELKTPGDIIKRIGDNSRIERFINSILFSVLISIFNLIIYSSILAFYNYKLLLLFLLGNGIYIAWILLFLKKRREFDHDNFKIASKSQNKLLQLIYGSREIILNNIEKEKRWEWEEVQAKRYKLSKKILIWEQIQSSGATIITSVIGITISIIVALAVINGEMTLGMMMSVQFIMGQIQAPLSSFLGLTHSYQDAKISMERLSEVVDNKKENAIKNPFVPTNRDITLKNVSFQYEGPNSKKILDSVTLSIPHNKITAIVGASGSGKTTILKLLLKLYQPTEGSINIGSLNLDSLEDYLWRDNCGAVMQDNYIFSDTILNNIVLKNYEQLDLEKVRQSLKVVNLLQWVESLPLQYYTRLGEEGGGLSQGQKQRLLIARVLYKNPQYIFLDEATNSLDAENETTIVKNLQAFTTNKTVLVIAHRLSTIKNADKILLLKDGKLIEEGTHSELLQKKGEYLNLINSQL